MNVQNKIPKGIKIIDGLMFILGLIMLILQIGVLMGRVSFEGSEDYKIASYASAIAEVIFIAPLFIIASIGLWKMKEWGVFTTLTAFGTRISMDVI